MKSASVIVCSNISIYWEFRFPNYLKIKKLTVRLEFDRICVSP